MLGNPKSNEVLGFYLENQTFLNRNRAFFDFGLLYVGFSCRSEPASAASCTVDGPDGLNGLDGLS